MGAPTVEPMSKVPARTTVDVAITLPASQGGLRTGFRWQAPHDMPAEEARAEIEADLFRRFLDCFLLTAPKEP